VTVLALAFAALAGQTGGQAQSSDSLRFARGFLVTGDYAVGGVDLPRGGGVGTINFNRANGNEIPTGAELIAAWAVWETIEPARNLQFTGAQFRGLPIDVAKVSRVTALPGTGASCWGSTGNSDPFLTTYRADVLHLLPKHYDANDKWTGRYLVNDADLLNNQLPLHTITLPQVGTGNTTTTSAGATLLLVWRHPDAPLKKIVMYDGAAVQATGAVVSHTLAGFYAASAAPSARITYLAATGADSRTERLLFNGGLVASNPFPAPIDANSDRGWSNPTFDVSAQMANRGVHPDFGEVVTTHVDPGTPYDCLSIAAIVFSTTIADVDGDGLPDGIESAALGLKDPPTPAFPNGQPLPNLHAMGAQVGKRDLFVEINSMWARGREGDQLGTTYGSESAPYNATTTSVEDENGHDHMPSPTVLKMVGDAYFANGITAHFDVGDLDAYRALFPCPAGDTTCDASAYLVPTAQARGGERIEERACENCQFADFPGTVGWPFGLRLYRDAPVGALGQELASFEQMQNAAPDHGALRRRFDRIRQPYVHYALFAHARGKARSTFPCLDATGNETGFDPSTPGVCAVGRNPQFHVPSSASGIADLPGGHVLVTLGLWDTEKFVGSPFVQASTFFHELGHNLNLWHSGRPAEFGDRASNTSTQVGPNCKPNYQSVMSYLFQVHGLADDTGTLHLDYSSASHNTLNEFALSDGALFPPAKYRSVWFTPVESALAASQGARAARRYCNGAIFEVGAPPDPLMARVQATSTVDAINWDGADGTPGASLDVNFDGAGGELDGFDDWSHVRLDQIAAGRTARIFRTASGDLLDFGSGDLLDFGSGDLLDFGSGDLLDFGSGTHLVHFGSGNFFTYGAGDLLDFGSGDLLDFGSGDLLDFGSGVLMFVGADGDLLDFGSGDLLDFGSGDLLDFGSGDLLDFGSGDLLDFGSGDLLDFGSGDLLDFGSGNGLQELDFETAMDIAPPSSHRVSICVLGVDCPAPQPAPYAATYHRFRLDWNAPTFGAVSRYDISRRRADSATAVIVGTSSDTTFVDTEELPNGVEFVYSVKAVFEDGSVSPHSDTVSKAAVNIPPVAVNDNYQTNQGVALSVVAPGVLGNDTDDVDSPASSRRMLTITSGPSHGLLSANADGSFTYTPEAGFSGIDAFTYVADNGPWPGDPTVARSGPSNAATVNITVTQVNGPPACHDIAGTVITGGSLTLNANCSDAGSDRLVVTAVGAAKLGTAILNPNGSFTYTATSPHVGTDTFSYTVSNGRTTATATATIRVIYGFTNVENLAASDNRTQKAGSAVRLLWQWTDVAAKALNTANAGAIVEAYACSTNGKLPGAYPLGFFTPQHPGNSNSFTFSESNLLWRFNWKLQYTDPATGQFFPLPAGTYVVQIKSSVTGQQDPGKEHGCANGTKVSGALITVR
jgi:hypothetical protein